MDKYQVEKVEGLGLLKAGHSAIEVSRKLGVPYPEVRKWKPEVELLETKEDLAEILDVDQVVLHELAEGVKDKLAELVEDGEQLVAGTLEKVDKLQSLQVDLQSSGIKLVDKLNCLLDDSEVRPNDLLVLVDAICKLQNAFFAKGTNVNVLNNATGTQPSSSGMSMFKSLQRSH